MRDAADFKIELTKFKPSVAEKISGISQTTQRNWRKRGILPKEQGHKLYDCVELAQLFAMGRLETFGIGPQKSVEIAPWMAVSIVAFIFANRTAFLGENPALDQLPTDTSPNAVRNRMIKLFRTINDDEAKPKEAISPLNLQPEINRSLLVNALHGRESGFDGRLLPARFFLWFENDEHLWCPSIEKGIAEYLERQQGNSLPDVIVSLDSYAMAEQMRTRTDEPFAALISAE